MNKKDLPATKEDISLLKGDIARLEAKSATKDDISLLKGDIARLEAKSATKDDISLLKGDISALKTELESKIEAVDAKLDSSVARLDAKIDDSTKRLALEIIRVQTGLQEVRETMSTKDDIERILRHIDGFAAQAIHYARADATRGQALIKVEVMADDHERRILALESARPRPQAP